MVESRRRFLGQLAGIGALTACPILLEGCQKPDIYVGLKSYPDQTLPAGLVSGIVEDLRSSISYPSLVQSGNLIKKSFNGPHGLEEIDRSLRNLQGPISISFENLGSTVAALGDRGDSLITPRITLRRINNSGAVTFIGVRTETTKFMVLLNTGLLKLPITPWVYRLMIAKEAGHLLYIPLARALLMDDIKKNYYLTEDRAVEDILIETAYNASDPQLRLPAISEIFNTFPLRIDYAGYWHITPDLAKLRAEGKLSKLDSNVLRINLQALDEALKRGLLVRKGTLAEYRWEGDSGPFSQNWFGLMKDIYQRNNIHTVSRQKRLNWATA